MEFSRRSQGDKDINLIVTQHQMSFNFINKAVRAYL